MTQFPSDVSLRTLLSNNDTEAIRAACAEAHPHAVAEQLADLGDSEVWAVLLRLEPPQNGEVFAHLPREQQIALANTENDREVAHLIEQMEADDRTDLIQQLDADQADRLLKLLSKEEREETQRLGAYDQDAVGAVMNVDVALLEERMTAGQALDKLREQAPRKETISHGFVVDDRGRLLGRVLLEDLVLAQPDAPISELMESEPVKVEATAPRTAAARIIQDYDLVLLPVVEGDDRLVGIVTVDDVMDVVEEEVSDTIYHKAGVGDLTHQKDHVWSERLTSGPIWYPVRVRIMYLMIVLVGGFIAYIWQGAPNDVPQLGVAVGVALFSVVTIAAFLGFALPYILVKLGFDHAPGADPFVTTIKDFTGLLIYFGLVAAIVPVDLPDPEEARLLIEPVQHALAMTLG